MQLTPVRKSAIAAVVFLITGEAMIRFDAATLFFQNGQRLENAAKHSALLDTIDRGEFRPNPETLRVLVIGDSYLYGAGVRPEGVFSAQVEAQLRAARPPGFTNATVLDATKPGNNTWANYQDLIRYAPAFQPHAVILAYNENDVYGQLADRPTGAARRTADAGDGKNLERVRSLRRLIYSSRLLEFLLVKINMELKLAGLVISGTEFDHQLNHSHSPNYPGWIRSQVILADLARYCRERKIRLLVANMPELNMLGNRGLYQTIDSTVETFFRSLPADYVNAVDPFLKSHDTNFAISRYDGHPNEAAHTLVAAFLSAHLLQAFREEPGQPAIVRSAYMERGGATQGHTAAGGAN